MDALIPLAFGCCILFILWRFRGGLYPFYSSTVCTIALDAMPEFGLFT